MQLGLSIGVNAPGGVAAPSLPPIVLAAAPVIVGDDTLSGVLTLQPVQVVEPADAIVTRQWLRNSVPIPGETGSIYQKTFADSGADIRVLVRCFRAGYAPRFAYSNTISLVFGGWFLDGAMILGTPGIPPQPTVTASIVEV
ncbi:hypothetical protein So717_42140 [Roseobacter cerasinus]|uniref:Uncharacterized protein n=1 Tax=Roseobacter cerasinus TaxID=2602289 RepID=A0A640VZD0_9RHOB|nr:hypothetical protein [Roseobacter cerasinus]GFE52461.1 hypothetical protein So717_42140 [Roseobacter cerasinus]